MTEKDLIKAEEMRDLVKQGHLSYNSAFINLTKAYNFTDKQAKDFLNQQ